MDNAKKTDIFENYPVPKAVAVLSVPAVLSTLVMVLYNIADTYFVGLLADAAQSSAVSLAAPVLLAFNAVTNLFGVGSASMMSRSLGRKDVDSAKRTAAFGFWVSLSCAAVISVCYTVFRAPLMTLLGTDATNYAYTEKYLFYTVTCGAVPSIMNVIMSNMVRSEGESVHASVGVISGCVLNIILDPFFVLPRFLGLGAAGAGLATLISNCFALSYLFFVTFLHRRTTIVCLNPKKARFRRDIAKEVFGVGVPASIQNLLNVTGSVILNKFAASFGVAAVAAVGIAHKVYVLPLYLTMGMTQGIMPLISYNFASGDKKRMKDSISFVLKISVVICVLR